MLKDTLAILLVVAGVAIAGADGTGDPDEARPPEVDVSRVPLSAALRFDAAIERLSLDCAVPPARERDAWNARGPRPAMKRRAAKRAPARPAAPPLPEVASRGGVDQTGLSSGL